MDSNRVKLSILENSELINIRDKEYDPNEIIVIKRDGREEKYMPEKMKKVCMWACDNKEIFANLLLDSTKIKLYNKIKISDVYDELIKTAVNNISRIYPQYEMIAAKLYLLKIYHDAWHIKDKTKYPDYLEVVKKGLSYSVYKKEVFESYTEDEINELSKIINIDNDHLFTYKSLYTFYSKYCLNYTKNKKLELPQHAYMRIALTLFYKEPKNIRLDLVKKFYKYVSEHYFTLATPIMLNAGTLKQQLSSCVLSKMGDDAHSIMDAIKDIAIYSKYKGGNAIDVSEIRSSGSYILGNNGFSSGPVPFLKIIESTIKAFNQGATRPGVCCIYFQWWHANFEELVVLKNNSGTEENRARQLKYSVKINDLLIKRVLSNKDVSLFNPNDVPNLIGKFGKEFEEEYIKYEENKSIKKKIVPARKVMEMLLKERAETGNIYMFHEENVNETSMLNRYINSSNLCCEIVLPSRESKLLCESSNMNMETGNIKISKEYSAGEISLCNLASINLAKWCFEEIKKQQDIIDIVVRGMDNTIDIADYPVQEGRITNKNYRYLGIGVLNYANYLALKKITIDTKEALEETHKLFDNWSFMIINASLKLAKEKGRYIKFAESKWAKGQLPLFVANKKALKLTDYQPDLNRWKQLASQIRQYGLRNAQLMAIAPTATSGKAINATESIEPIQHFFYKEDGKINLPTLVPNIRKNSNYYKIATDCNQYALLKLAAIRQIYLDQAQSINSYFKKITSLTDFTLYHIYGFELGIKTYYYCKTEKDVIEDICESCT
ncbi:ribonucleoside-diphosphate reductase subunit alpha [Malacoplasma muris]|uniref:ribonucleoside-diphosphate reductase subunit alpha n=1 Tax=Malacoplasma muris TaxID=2119 RepID=UPI00398E35C6